ncbi:hypothetical protein [Desulfosporosinus shakirovi]|uniref:hypothetical protein n=1 Tax=Desulfosporosinus shakirovi TaxID=2885154 RepID=UPI001E2AFC8B|nr:hypothetical protein [Desulfosporosinus sp. SRJS8]MCB8815731.1 hypothetical protein [Desulfosporosinus sp. SRJS8]
MSNNEPNDTELLQSLLNKIILYRITRNMDKVIKDRNITHAELSGNTGRSGNWFNKIFNGLEDMRLSTFIKAYVAVLKISGNESKHNDVEITSVFDEELFRITSVSLDLSIIDNIDDLLSSDKDLYDFFFGLKVYVEALKGLRDVVTPNETDAYYRVLERVSHDGRNNNGF